jgi:hypothetical protein
MLDVTLRLAGRSLHLVRHAGDCESCSNQAAHTRVDVRPFVQGEIERAVRGNASALAAVRDLVAMHVPLPPAHRGIDAEILKHIAWLIETERLTVVECIEVRRELPDIPRRPAAPRTGTGSRPQPRPAPVDDEVKTKTWVAIELLEEVTNKPVAGARYIVKGPSGTFEGTLDAKGQAKVTDIDSGMYGVSFPEIEAREWKKA